MSFHSARIWLRTLSIKEEVAGCRVVTVCALYLGGFKLDRVWTPLHFEQSQCDAHTAETETQQPAVITYTVIHLFILCIHFANKWVPFLGKSDKSF